MYFIDLIDFFFFKFEFKFVYKRYLIKIIDNFDFFLLSYNDISRSVVLEL